MGRFRGSSSSYSTVSLMATSIATPLVSVSPESSSEPTELFVLMSSLTYLVICLGAIFLLSIVLVLLFLVWCTWLHPRIKNYEESGKTIRYSTLPSDEEEVKKSLPSHSYRHGLGYDTSHQHLPPKTSQQWSQVPVSPHVDVNAGHLLLSYIENNLQDKNRLDKEWEALETYIADDNASKGGSMAGNKHKNRYPDILPYDHNRVKLETSISITGSDYINASFIIDVDPNFPKYVATQGPMQHTVPDFWQMVWEQNIYVIVMLTPLNDMGLSQSCQYWPTNGIASYHTYEVRLVSEHHHSRDYIIRSFYLFNTNLQRSRTVTQFHFLTWSSAVAPATPTPLLEFRRMVNTAHKQHNTPLLIHCSEGVGRTGTYCLIDMTLSRISAGAKEINLAATVEHLRDQRPQMVKTKAQFEFALSALVAETQQMMDAAQKRPPMH